MITASKAACPGGAQSVPFDAPTGWDGTCTAMDAISAAASVQAPPPELGFTSGCSPSDDPPLKLTGGKTRSLECGTAYGVGEEPGTCLRAGDTCMVPNVSGFLTCIANAGDLPCPDGWPNKHLIFEDAYECHCTCGDPTGEACSSTLSVYADAACSQLLGSATLSSDNDPVCIDVPPGSPLGSKKATPPVYQSGTCTPSLTKSLPATLCCLP
jgi:hypothetical protein